MAGPGYAGPFCDKAGVEPGKVYLTIDEAQDDVEKLQAVNPVEWVVEKYIPNKINEEFGPCPLCGGEAVIYDGGVFCSTAD